MRIVLTSANKSGLYNKFLQRLIEANNSIKGASKGGYISFPAVFEKICRGFSIKKSEAWECLFLLKEFGFIEIIRFHGIKLNYQIKK